MLTLTIMSKAEFTVLVPEGYPASGARTANKHVKGSMRLLEDATDDTDSSSSSEDQEKDEKETARYNEEREEDTIDESQEDESEEEDNDPILRSVSRACNRKKHKFCYKSCKSAYRALCSDYNCSWPLRREFKRNCKKRCKK
ncbi:hypothetical protein evm_010383 [Chilo suppressalis]|nr:hypothetical protein evm_010383 [Chilo suppressalis]